MSRGLNRAPDRVFTRPPTTRSSGPDASPGTSPPARAPDFIMEPQEYYEKHGLYIPNVIFPTGNVIVDNDLWVYYGVCDTAIALATAPVQRILDSMQRVS